MNFIQEAAKEGEFSIELQKPPAFLLNRSLELFGGSRFSYCVYATSLGFLDFCIAQYTITPSRGGTADWLVLGNQPLRLITHQGSSMGKHEKFKNALGMIFSPFQLQTWLFIIFCVLPVLGTLLVVHEYGQPTGNYDKKHHVVLKDGKEVVEKAFPVYRHIIRATYYSLLSVLQGEYIGQSVLSAGAKLHLIGLSCFILTLITVYTGAFLVSKNGFIVCS